jgi:hypothetical protein
MGGEMDVLISVTAGDAGELFALSDWLAAPVI